MPTYEYRCQKCGKKHEASQSIMAKPLAKCPKPRCGGRLSRLLSSGSGFIFKGSGFYITDYRSKSYQEGKKKDAKPSGPSSTSGGSCASGGSSNSSSCKSGGCS